MEKYIIFISLLMGGCQSHQYFEQTKYASGEFYQLLHNEKYCATLKECKAQELILVSSGDGVYLEIYGIEKKTIPIIASKAQTIWNSEKLQCVPKFEILVFKEQKNNSENRLYEKIILKQEKPC
jgi:hypothetical protein